MALNDFKCNHLMPLHFRRVNVPPFLSHCPLSMLHTFVSIRAVPSYYELQTFILWYYLFSTVKNCTFTTMVYSLISMQASELAESGTDFGPVHHICIMYVQ